MDLDFIVYFQLPEDDKKRQIFLKNVIKKRNLFVFVQKIFTLKKYADIERINVVWLIKKNMSNYSDTYNYLKKFIKIILNIWKDSFFKKSQFN